MHTYALVDPIGIAENVILWDGTSAYAAPTGYTLIQIDGLSPMPGIGWTLSGTTWTAPAAPTAKPDPQGFTVAILNSSATTAEKSYVMSQLPGLVAELDNADPTVIEAAWEIIEASGQLSSGTITLIKSLAVQYAIPIS
jgi:hypothetical protein